MRHEVLMEMSLQQLDQYGEVCGIDVSGLKTKKSKVARLEERRGRTVDVDVLGTTLTIPVRAMHDKFVNEALEMGGLTNKQAEELMRRLLGDDQYDAVVERCTDEDGIVDLEGLGLVFSTIVNSPELKNY